MFIGFETSFSSKVAHSKTMGRICSMLFQMYETNVMFSEHSLLSIQIIFLAIEICCICSVEKVLVSFKYQNTVALTSEGKLTRRRGLQTGRFYCLMTTSYAHDKDYRSKLQHQSENFHRSYLIGRNPNHLHDSFLLAFDR